MTIETFHADAELFQLDESKTVYVANDQLLIHEDIREMYCADCDVGRSRMGICAHYRVNLPPRGTPWCYDEDHVRALSWTSVAKSLQRVVDEQDLSVEARMCAAVLSKDVQDHKTALAMNANGHEATRILAFKMRLHEVAEHAEEWPNVCDDVDVNVDTYIGMTADLVAEGHRLYAQLK